MSSQAAARGLHAIRRSVLCGARIFLYNVSLCMMKNSYLISEKVLLMFSVFGSRYLSLWATVQLNEERQIKN
jgi:hypothetical protein